MKKLNVFLLFLLAFALLFTACPGDSSGLDETALDIAEASMGAGALSSMFYENYDQGMYETFPPIGLDIDDSGPEIIFVFTDFEYNTEEFSDDYITIDGTFTVESEGISSILITFTNFSLEHPSENLSATINGTLNISETAFSGNLVVSGVKASPVTVIIELTGTDWSATNVTSATIDGVDYTEEFQSVLDDME